MRLSAPIYRLKRQARLHARAHHIPLHKALDEVAKTEGFVSWSHLSKHHKPVGPATDLLAQLRLGSLVLLAARPGQGKTLLGLDLAVAAQNRGDESFVFSLEYTEDDIRQRLIDLGHIGHDSALPFTLDVSDEICADRIAQKLEETSDNVFVVVDYLQLLDQKRSHPSLQMQLEALAACAEERRATIVLISQVDRRFDRSGKDVPDQSHIRLPNPIDLSLFDRACFLHAGKLRLTAIH